MATAEAEVDLRPRILMLTDIVDSTKTFGALGEAAAARLWAEHDAAARNLLGQCAGTEIERGDGFLLVFDAVADAARFAAGYHALLGRLSTPLATRIGIHAGLLRVRANTPDHVSQGARMLDLDGQAKATVARIQSLAQAGQTLASAPAVEAWPDSDSPRRSHGYWRLKGLADPLELFEIGPDAARFAPPPDAEKVWRVVLQGDLWLPAREVPHTLPAERDRFVGRGEHAARAALAIEQSRLVSLLGIGGTGKTRLALRLGWQRLGDHPGGVWFCDLSAAVTPDGIVHATAQGLQLPLGAADPVQQVGDAIAGRGDCLVILDNFEQVARHAEATLGRWLQRAPQARFLVTSREVLGIVGEQALALPPLPQDEGEALLRERAAQAGAPGFEPKDEQAVPELVRLLDGLPLAIELAASRMHVMGPADMLPRMNQRFKLLASRGGRPDRQATLRATLDWSWDLLSEPERSALAQLSVFEGGFTLEAAQAVVDLSEFAGSDADDDAHADLWVVDVVQALVDKSLVRRVGERRFGLLSSVGEYAALRLALLLGHGASDATAGMSIHSRHASYFARLPEAQATRNRCADVDNLMSAARWAVAQDHSDLAVRVALNAWAALKRTGPFDAAVRLAEQLLSCQSLSEGNRPWAQWILACALFHQGQSHLAQEQLAAAMSATSDRRLAVLSRATSAEVASTLGEAAKASVLVESALVDARSLGDKVLLCKTLMASGGVLIDQGQVQEAQVMLLEALSVAKRIGDERWVGGIEGNLGAIAHYMGDRNEATGRYRAALALAESAGDRRWEGNMCSNLGLVLHEEGQNASALSYLKRARALADACGDRRLASTATCNTGLAMAAMGRANEAMSAFDEAARISAVLGDTRTQSLCKVYLARTLLQLGQADLAEVAVRQLPCPDDEAVDATVAVLVACVSAQLSATPAWTTESDRLLQVAERRLALANAGSESEPGHAVRMLKAWRERQKNGV